MSLVTLREILADCQHEGWAVPAFDVINYETVVASLEGAAAERAPVILMVLPSHTPLSQWPGLVAMVQAQAAGLDLPVCLHLDHAIDLEQVEAALDLGFSSVMIDGSTLPLAANISLTRQVVESAHARGVSVEAELGHVGGGDEVLDEDEAAGRLTPVGDAARFVDETQVDALAVAIGTVHGLYRAEPKLDFERLAALRAAVPVPLVMHGGSGTPDQDIRRTIREGICKINIWTEISLAFAATLREELSDPAASRPLYQVMAAAQATAQDVVQHKIRLLGAAGRVP